MPRSAALLLVALVVAAGAHGLAGGASSPCEGFTIVPGQGPSCPEPGGWRVLLADGSWLLTHGPDPAPTLVEPASHSFAAAIPPACVEDPLRDFHGHVIYARRLDAPDRYASLAPQIRHMMHMANGKLREEAALFGITLDYRMRCEGGEVLVSNAVLPRSPASFSGIVSDLKLLGYDSERAKYWVWYDGFVDCNCGGQGDVRQDDSWQLGNQNNRGPSYGITYGYTGYNGAFIMMHENGHNLGAVQRYAPKSSGGFHCNDGQDVMCYSDGGPTSAYQWNVCTSRLFFDCNHDTYFHPDPPAGSWLEWHWNLAAPLNRYVQGCLFHTGVLAVGLLGRDVENTNVEWIDLPPACAGRAFSLEARVPANDVDVCWYADTTLLSCNTLLFADRGRVPATATRARVYLDIGSATDYHLSIV